MPTELLIFYTLRRQECTIYKLKKAIDSQFFLFCSVSLSVIHRALKGLEAAEYVKVKKSMSKGGQKSSRYSITQEGEKHFERLIVKELPTNPVLAYQMANIRILLLGEVEKPVRSRAIKVLKDYYKGVLADLENFLADSASESLNREYIKREINAIDEKIKFLSFQDLS